jgi:hypothetical protein
MAAAWAKANERKLPPRPHRHMLARQLHLPTAVT